MPAIADRPIPKSPLSEAPLSDAHERVARRGAPAYAFVFVATLALTPLLILAGANQGYGQILAAIIVLAALAIIPWRPIIGVYLIVICAVTIEQEPLVSTPIGTDHLYVFYWPIKLQGLPERPIGFFILAVLAIIVVTRLLLRRRALYGGRLFYPFILFLGCVTLGILHGLASGGTFRIIVLEIRPFWYLFVTYILAYNTVIKVSHIRNILWITIVGTAIKGVQGVFIVYEYLGGHIEGHNEIMAHEQSFFFVLVLLLLALMALHRFQRGFFFAILISLPCLLLALVANNRRADYVALLVGIGVAWALIIILRPEARRRLIPALILCIVLGAGYVVAFQKSDGPLGQPARAVVSVFSPNAADERDAASNAYRIIENYDLKYTESQSPLLGYGFGKPFLQPVALPNVFDLDPYYLYIPHNNILWVWMRLGPLGFGALWYLIGGALVMGCLIARRLRNQQLQLFAIFVVSTVVMEVILAYGDYQFFFYRNMIYIGILLGALLRLPAIERVAPGAPARMDDDPGDDLSATPHDSPPTSARSHTRRYFPLAPLAPVPVSATLRATSKRVSWKWTQS